MAKRYILTGAPGCGKTSVIRALELRNCLVVEEAATDIIAYEQSMGSREPWRNKNFIGKITELQKRRQLRSDSYGENKIFFDRSPICTYALAIYLGFEITDSLQEEIERIRDNNIYHKNVFFVENLGYIKNTDARQITYEEAMKFEEIHINAYENFGYHLTYIKPASLEERVDSILALL
jgi:predicted ATPase